MAQQIHHKTAQQTVSKSTPGFNFSVLNHQNEQSNQTTLCNHPAYLFWKMQSQLTKLGNKLNAQKRRKR
ncbi:hypothetical protein [Thiomicrorhabdus hydrogeniphila]